MQSNSKLNTVLLVILIVLVFGIGILLLSRNKEGMQYGANSTTPGGYTQTQGDAEAPDYQPNPTSVSLAVLPKYVASNNWPPTITNSPVAYACMSSSEETQTVVQKVINGRTYCVNTFSDCGAGHCGGDYTYTTANGGGTKTTTFNLQWNNSCGGYGGPGDPQYDQCKSDQTYVFSNLDVFIDSLMFP